MSLLVIGGLAACGGSGGSAGSGTSGSGSSTSSGGSTAAVVHLGCHQYCQQAGGYGGGPGGRPTVRVVTRGEVMPNSDGSVTIKQTCLLPVRCAGAVVLGPASQTLATICKPFIGRVDWWGQADLNIAARQTQDLAVPLSPCARRELAQHGRVAMSLTADAGLVPACSKIPALAALCHKFVTSPGYTPDQGDGLNRLVSGGFTLVSRNGS